VIAHGTAAEVALRAALAAVPSMAPLGDGTWRLGPAPVRPMVDGHPLAPDVEPVVRVSAHIDDEWIAMASPPLPGSGALLPWDALVRNGRASGPAKLVLSSDGRGFEIRAEIPVEDEVDLMRRVREACEGIRRLVAAASRPEDVSEHPVTPVEHQRHDRQPGADLDLSSLASEAGWPFVLRSSDRLAIDLQVPGQFQQAIVEARDSGHRARVTLVIARSPSAAVRAAAASFLLMVAALVRMARAGACEREDETMLFFETDFGAGLSAAELHHALSALAVTCRMAGRETKALMDEGVARAYLAAHGWAASQ
jgi:hypothetical protein